MKRASNWEDVYAVPEQTLAAVETENLTPRTNYLIPPTGGANKEKAGGGDSGLPIVSLSRQPKRAIVFH